MALLFRSTVRASVVFQKLAAPSANSAVNSLRHQKVRVDTLDNASVDCIVPVDKTMYMYVMLVGG